MGLAGAGPLSAERGVRGENSSDLGGAVVVCLLSSPAPTTNVTFGPVS